MTTWDKQTFSETNSKNLNFGSKTENSGVSDNQVESYKKLYMTDKVESRMDESEEMFDDFDETQYSKKETKTNKGFLSFFTNLAGTVLDDENLDPMLSALKMDLQTKNVAVTVADQICKSVSSELIGKTVGPLSTIKNTVRKAMEETLTKILTPNRDIDVLRDAQKMKEQGNVYSVVFVGVNGVGKSTSLSKICYWLKQNNFKVLIAACDTFRSGAVEQLRVHTKCLNVDLFERGYGKDAASIANEALLYAKKNGYDVVLIDTAGRMQDNEPLMKALNKLIVVNDPDLVLFVGEALVGNDGVDQLVKFNTALNNIQKQENHQRPIDGVVLTKYDTIDDKVGATISMVYSTGIPILFCGVGQTYNDLKKLSVKSVVQSLLN
jgi:signal recognition particle receptor subunit alpha